MTVPQAYEVSTEMKFPDRVRFTTTSDGTDDLVVGAAPTGFRKPYAAGVRQGDEIPYVIFNGARFARGLGTYDEELDAILRSDDEIGWDGSTDTVGRLELSGTSIVTVSAYGALLEDVANYGPEAIAAAETAEDAAGEAEDSATEAASAAALAQAAAALVGSIYASQAAGEAATTTGQSFLVAVDGEAVVYSRTVSGSDVAFVIATPLFIGAISGTADTRASVQSRTIPAATQMIHTTGFATAGDGGHGCYVRVSSAPTPTSSGFRTTDRFLPNGSTSSGNGGWWQLRPFQGNVNIKQFGAVSDTGTTYTAENDAAFADAFTYSRAMQFTASAASDPFGGVNVNVTNGHFTVATSGCIIPASYTTKGMGYNLVGQGHGNTVISFLPTTGSRVLFDNNALMLCNISGITFHSNSIKNKFWRCNATRAQQRFNFSGCWWTGQWGMGFLLYGSNNNSEYQFDLQCGVSGTMLNFLHTPGLSSDEDQHVNHIFTGFRFWPTGVPDGSWRYQGNLSGTTFTISSTDSDYSAHPKVGQRIVNHGLAETTTVRISDISGYDPGTRTGTFTVDTDCGVQTGNRWIGGFDAATFTGSISGTTLTVTAVSAGVLGPKTIMGGSTLISGRYAITEQLTSTESGGALGGTGTYELSESPGTIASTTLSCSGLYLNRWINMNRGGHIHMYACDASGLRSGRLFELRGNTHARGVCQFISDALRMELKSSMVATCYNEWPHGGVVFRNTDQSSQEGAYGEKLPNFETNFGDVQGAMVTFDGGEIIGAHRINWSSEAFFLQPRVEYRGVTFLSFDGDIFPHIVWHASGGANQRRPQILFDDACRGDVFTRPTTRWAATTAYTVGQQRYIGELVMTCKVAGTSGSTPPRTTGEVTDGTVTWTITTHPRNFRNGCSYPGIKANSPATIMRVGMFGGDLPGNAAGYLENRILVIAPYSLVEVARMSLPAGATGTAYPADFTMTAGASDVLCENNTTPASAGFDTGRETVLYRAGLDIQSRTIRLECGLVTDDPIPIITTNEARFEYSS